MESPQATRTCDQCHKEVAEANFALHVTHCSRFLCVCPDCQEAVPRDRLDQHREEEHTLVRCSKCHKKLERCQLMDHESDECEERLQSCRYCELELPWKELEEHHVVCGSRTELCRDCGRYVTLRDQAQHSLACSASDSGSNQPQAASKPQSIKKSCSICMALFPAEEIKKHELACAVAGGSAKEEELEEREDEKWVDEGGLYPRLSNIYTASSLNRSGAAWGDGEVHMNQISSCPHCHLALPHHTLLWHEGKCKIHLLLRMSERRGKEVPVQP